METFLEGCKADKLKKGRDLKKISQKKKLYTAKQIVRLLDKARILQWETDYGGYDHNRGMNNIIWQMRNFLGLPNDDD